MFGMHPSIYIPLLDEIRELKSKLVPGSNCSAILPSVIEREYLAGKKNKAGEIMAHDIKYLQDGIMKLRTVVKQQPPYCYNATDFKNIADRSRPTTAPPLPNPSTSSTPPTEAQQPTQPKDSKPCRNRQAHPHAAVLAHQNGQDGRLAGT